MKESRNKLLEAATLHDYNHRLSLAFCYQVVHDVLPFAYRYGCVGLRI